MIQGSVSGVGGDSIYYTVSPTGGIIVLEPNSTTDFSSWSLTRYFVVSGQAVSGVQLVHGAAGASPTQVFIDIGEGVNAPLDSNSLYAYGFETSNGTIMTPALSPACSVVLEQDNVSAILYRALQSGIASLALPAGFNSKPQIIHAMPLAGDGVPVLPSIAFNETLLQPQSFRIGEDVDEDSAVNEWQIAVQALRHYTIFIMATTVREREYYKDAVIGIFSSLLPVLGKIGNNVSHRFQSTGSQLVGRQNEPGYYFAEILLEFTGLYSIGITTSYGVVSGFAITENTSQVSVLIS